MCTGEQSLSIEVQLWILEVRLASHALMDIVTCFIDVSNLGLPNSDTFLGKVHCGIIAALLR